LIEIGIPFSDPVADGKSIQYSSQKALENGINIDRTFQLLSSPGCRLEIPLVLMTYYNPVLSYGLVTFAENAKRKGVNGLIIPDLIPEEGPAVEKTYKENGLDLIYLVAPTTEGRRRKKIIEKSRGFVYLVSVTGVTGKRKTLPATLNSFVRQVKKESILPVCVGFGISTPEQAKAVSQVADGVIMGSALVEIIRKEKSSSRIVRQARRFIRNLRERMDSE